MASGFSKRFGNENKLLVSFRGKPLARHTLDLVCEMRCFSGIFFVAADDEIAALADGLPVTVIRNSAPKKGQRESVRLGVEAASAGDRDYYIFFPCDQPLLDAATVRLILEAREPGRIVEPRLRNEPVNPCLFSAAFRQELLTLGEGEHPRNIKNRHLEAVITVETANVPALEDVDNPADLERMRKLYEQSR
jgi:molybdenum cofactor cytidylyltransferase